MGNYNYKIHTVYMGIDVHKKTYACASFYEGNIIKKDTMPADPSVLIAYIKNNFVTNKIETAYEAGFSGFHLHRQLVAAGINNIVVNPGSIEIASRDKVKNDKRDAKKIAVQLAAGRLKCIYIPTLEQESKRTTTRLRNSILKLRNKIGLKIKALLFTQGLIQAADDRVVSKKWLAEKLTEVERLNYPIGFFYTIKHYSNQWNNFTNDLQKIKKELLNMQTEEEKTILSIYKSAPGIGELTALILKDELGDMSQFSNEKKLFNYLGFTPTEYSSGNNVRYGHISRQGQAALRHILVEASWIAIRKDPKLMEIYQRIKHTRGGKIAIIGIARRLSGRLRSCLQKRIFYEINFGRTNLKIKKEVKDTVQN